MIRSKTRRHFQQANGSAACDSRWQGDTSDPAEVTCLRCKATWVFRPPHGEEDRGPLQVDLGCGVNKPEGWIGLDCRDLPGVDIVHDVALLGLPFDDDEVDALRAKDFFEHLQETVEIFNECWRVLKAGGNLTVEVPRFPHVDAVKDPTHVSFFAVETFTEYLGGPDRLEAEYGMRLWDLISIQHTEHRIWATLKPRGKPMVEA